MKRQLIIFCKNPQLSKVKTRLAADVGDAYALAIYLRLVQHTRTICNELHDVDRVVFYSSHIDTEDNWSAADYRRDLQQGADLGERMSNAFRIGFERGYDEICIIGTDCQELQTDHLRNAFEQLSRSDVVIGPAFDGGYYLLGMRKLHPELFMNKQWSTASVLNDTLEDCRCLHLKVTALPALRDVDTKDDLPPGWLPDKLL